MGLRRRRKRWPFLLLIGLGLAVGFALLEVSLAQTVIAFTKTEAHWKATKAINQAVLASLDDGTTYDDLVRTQKDSRGQVIFMEANVITINRLASQTSLRAQEQLENLSQESISIPLGQVLGSKLLASYGPKVGVELTPLGTVKVQVRNSFESAGINQTRHWISLLVQSRLQVVIPFIEAEVPVEVEIPVADAVIVGPVPGTFLQMSLGGRNSTPNLPSGP